MISKKNNEKSKSTFFWLEEQKGLPGQGLRQSLVCQYRWGQRQDCFGLEPGTRGVFGQPKKIRNTRLPFLRHTFLLLLSPFSLLPT
jgi:hypothetical protein